MKLSTVTYAPLPGCDSGKHKRPCDICRWLLARAEQERDLAANYAKYEAGLLVSRDDRE